MSCSSINKSLLKKKYIYKSDIVQTEYLEAREDILSELKFLFQNDVDATVVDHGHVLASVTSVDPDLIENVIDFYLWLKASLDLKVLKILLKQQTMQTCNALELSVHLGVFRLATEILNTEGVYIMIRHVGPFEYRASRWFLRCCLFVSVVSNQY